MCQQILVHQLIKWKKTVLSLQKKEAELTSMIQTN